MALARYDKLRRQVQDSFSPTTATLVDEALAYAAEKLGDEMRYDGRPMLDHAVQVAQIVMQEVGLGRN